MIVDPKIPYSYSQLMRDILRLKTAYPKLITSGNAGFSVEGRQLPVVTLGSGKTKVFFCGAHHAREYITSAYLMYTLNVYAEAAARGKKLGDYDMAGFLSKCTATVMPMVNPDGVTLAQGGLKAVQDIDKVKPMAMIQPSYSEWKANVNGVDLNRQYPALWDQKNVVVDEPASELYNGEAPASEPEVKAVMRVCKRNIFKSALSFHTKGEAIFYADKNTDGKIPGAKAIARRIAGVSGYQLMPVSKDPGLYAAGFENWFRQEFLYPGFLVELTPATGGAMPHSDRDFFSLVWDQAKYICAEAIDAMLEGA
ncbi:MAG: M14 family zinc carboxypeptidase [Eubacteriales bacterium]|nr:M14 family zinc carboxypeptidase [Eubacteriales bacterium]